MGICMCKNGFINQNSEDKCMEYNELTLQLDDDGNQKKALNGSSKQNQQAFSSTNKELLDDSNMKGGEQEEKRKKRNKNKVQAVRDDIDKELQIFENVKKVSKQMTKAEINQNIKFLSNHFVFALLSNPDKEEIIKKMFYCENTSEYVFKQGDQASSYFVIVKGQCQVIINNDPKKTLKEGDCFGELALLYGAPRSASVKAIGQCAFWAIDRNTFKKAIAEVVQKESQENRSFLDKVPFFDQMTSEQKDAIANVSITQVFKKGDIIVNEGDMASSYYIIKKGLAGVIRAEKEVKVLKPGETFGEQALYENSNRSASVKAIEDDSRLIAIGKDQIQIALGDKVEVILNNNIIKNALDNDDQLKQLTGIQKEKVITALKQVKYEKDQCLFRKNKSIDKIIIVLKGEISYENDTILVKQKQVFGSKWLQQKHRDVKIEKNIIFTENSLVAETTFQKFIEALGGGTFEQIVEKNKESYEHKYMVKVDDNELKKQYENLKLEEMISIKKLGFGQFGSVYLVKSKQDGNKYALKVIQKQQIIEQQLEKHLLQEKKVLETAQFPFIMKFIRSFKDNNNIYFLVEYIQGLELFDVIRELGLLSVQDSQFYIGSLLLCVEYLHKNSIIYRDIKPENIMIDHTGYMKLIDMGTAKFLKGKGARTFTIIGTPHYMAPEIITGKGYSYNVDLWSVGICLYEFMCGEVPFAEDAEDPYEIYEEIIKKPISYPGTFKDKTTKNIISQLLNKTPELRLGGSYNALKANVWFDKFDFDKLMEKQIKAPFIPPADKLIPDDEFYKLESQGNSIMADLKKENLLKYKKEKAKDPNWDKDF